MTYLTLQNLKTSIWVQYPPSQRTMTWIRTVGANSQLSQVSQNTHIAGLSEWTCTATVYLYWIVTCIGIHVMLSFPSYLGQSIFFGIFPLNISTLNNYLMCNASFGIFQWNIWGHNEYLPLNIFMWIFLGNISRHEEYLWWNISLRLFPLNISWHFEYFSVNNVLGIFTWNIWTLLNISQEYLVS